MAHWTEILAIALLVAYVLGMIVFFAYRKVHHKPISPCACSHALKGRRLVKEYHRSCKGKE